MDNTGREAFWNVLKNLHENNGASLIPVSPLPRYLCRYRSVNENALQQLNDNTQYFSSADYYDDPFDTYFHIDFEKMISTYEAMRKALIEREPGFIDDVHRAAKLSGQNPDEFINKLSNTVLDFPTIHGQLLNTRLSIQKRLFSICFCEDEYNETLWLKYAGDYTGFVQVYDMDDPNTFLCGKEEKCKKCPSSSPKPSIYPVYYSDLKYDATMFALGMLMLDQIQSQANNIPEPLYNTIQQRLLWEPERISLIKKKCHEYDREWRMIRPTMCDQRSFIRMKPCKVIIGLRTPAYKSRLIASAATIAGVNEIHKLFINDSDELDSKPVQL